MKINVISVGKLSSTNRILADYYHKMVKWKLKETEITYSKKVLENQIKSYEAELINAQIDESSYKIILDVKGKQLTSEDFSLIFKRQMIESQNVNIVIGGAFGLDKSIINKANYLLSLSAMTLPHQLAKIILLEQIYRAQTILEGHPYHK